MMCVIQMASGFLRLHPARTLHEHAGDDLEAVGDAMLQFLKQERADLGDGFQSTYIDNLNVQLEGVDDRADKTIATLTFTGVSKTSRFDQGEVFSESWNMERAQGENQPWLVAGIRQNG